MRNYENFRQNYEIPDDRNNPVRSNRAMAGRPRKHQYSEHWHQPLWPHQPGDSKNQVQLNNEVEDEVFHIKEEAGEPQFYYSKSRC